ncbi:hypothetical protein OCEANICA350_10772 [Oceanicaulis sp. 350]|nr:hypothetical protein OCEANICA350_10772 [Oceanicaulis sp. 350]
MATSFTHPAPCGACEANRNLDLESHAQSDVARLTKYESIGLMADINMFSDRNILRRNTWGGPK